ncbi:quinohemoprotein amine dehydrogenase subunit alpha [Maricurvus nonylphenolicus]|uniref:quinohemoprotein amine dehydrogenase subunit alpha n=1 Tax=Maricurvus nonylphenolicus TaxID=1008307 RepID=UPI0036F1FDE5
MQSVIWIVPVLTLLFFANAGDASEKILQQKCMGCHIPESFEPLKLSRISHQRKSPEGWLMTIGRMQVMHGLQISEKERAALVQHLADTQGLAPSESKPYRYILERRLNHSEQRQPELAEMCARCHSEARVGLQRREESEWRHLVHFHLGQWPSVEFSAMGRDRDWLGIALNEVVPYLGEKYPLESEAWSDWQQEKKQNIEGRWRLVGSMPGKGDFQGDVTVAGLNKGKASMHFTGEFANGEKLKGEGELVLYSGYEWRGSLAAGEQRYKQVFALSEDGKSLSGRMYLSDHEELGVDIHGVRGDESKLLAMSPNYIAAGNEAVISIRGANLKGAVTLGEGLELVSEIARSEDEILVQVRAGKTATAFNASVSVGNVKKTNAITIYDRVSEIRIEPGYAVARVGDGGGSQGKVKAAFEAVGYAAGKDGIAGTSDDLKIGVLPATWRIAAFSAKAEEDRDVEFAGVINAKTGVFTPGDAGPNPKRKFKTNNAGHLSVIAEVLDGEQLVKGTSELIVTVQRWNNPPIR